MIVHRPDYLSKPLNSTHKNDPLTKGDVIGCFELFC